mgnify:CR=1 FL=1
MSSPPKPPPRRHTADSLESAEVPSSMNDGACHHREEDAERNLLPHPIGTPPIAMKPAPKPRVRNVVIVNKQESTSHPDSSDNSPVDATTEIPPQVNLFETDPMNLPNKGGRSESDAAFSVHKRPPAPPAKTYSTVLHDILLSGDSRRRALLPPKLLELENSASDGKLAPLAQDAAASSTRDDSSTNSSSSPPTVPPRRPFPFSGLATSAPAAMPNPLQQMLPPLPSFLNAREDTSSDSSDDEASYQPSQQSMIAAASKPAVGPSAKESKVLLVGKEIVNSERTYVQNLNDCVTLYVKPLQTEELLPPNLEVQLAELLRINSTLLQSLEDAGTTGDIGKVFLELGPFLRVYIVFCDSYESMMKTLEQNESNKKWRGMLDDIAALPTWKGQALTSYLIMPVQRIPRYLLLLKELKRAYDADLQQQLHIPPQSYANLEKATDLISSIAAEVNEGIRLRENRAYLLKLKERLDKPFDIVQPHRFVVRQSLLVKVCRKANKERLVFLFNDILMYGSGSSESKGAITLHNVIPLDTVMVRQAEVDISHAFSISSSVKSMTFIADSDYDRDEWVRDIRHHAELSKVRRLQRVGGITNNDEETQAAPEWVTDSQRESCVRCSRTFTFLRRRHHCRRCGDVFCAKCCFRKVPLRGSSEPARVCDACFEVEFPVYKETLFNLLSDMESRETM